MSNEIKLSENIYYRIYHTKDDTSLDADTKRWVYLKSNNTGKYQQWQFKRRPYGYQIIQHATGLPLDGNSKGEVYLFDRVHDGTHQQWKIEPLERGKCRLVQVATARVLDGDANRHWKSCVYTLGKNYDGYQFWEIIPAFESWERNNVKIIYDEIPHEDQRPNAVRTIIDETYRNNSTAPMLITVNEERSFTRTFTWGFVETLKYGAKLTGSLGIPLLAEGNIEISSEFSFEANQSWTKTDTRSYGVQKTIDVQPGTRVRVRGVVEWFEAAKIGFTYEVDMSARMLTNTGERYASVEEIKSELLRTGFTGTILRSGTVSGRPFVRVSVKGWFQGDYGLKTDISADELNKYDDDEVNPASRDTGLSLEVARTTPEISGSTINCRLTLTNENNESVLYTGMLDLQDSPKL